MLLVRQKPNYYEATQNEDGTWNVAGMENISEEQFHAQFDVVPETKREQGIIVTAMPLLVDPARNKEIAEVLQNNEVQGQTESDTDSGSETD